MIKVNKLNKSYGETTVLEDISFSINKGQVFGVMGRNGAGKTTLIRSILQKVEYSGSIDFESQLMGAKGKLNSELIYFVSDTPHVYEYLTGIEYIQFVLKVKNRDLPPNSRILEILSFFGIEEKDTHRLLKEYSFGMKRKIVLATGFLMKPEFMILDEPTIGLDVPSVIILKKLILASADQKMTFLVTSHDPTLMSELCEALLILDDHKMVYLNKNFADEKENLSELYIS